MKTSINPVAVPAFLTKLWDMVNDPETDHLISWNPSGSSFTIKNEPQFTFKLLPAYYKHNNMSSFVRQLNMYGFHKLTTLEDSGKTDKDEMHFYHPHFRKGNFLELREIKRKAASLRATVEGGELSGAVPPEKLAGIVGDVKNLHRKQTSINKQLDDLKQENAVLWQEIIVLRQRHMKQQQIVNKLIQFLVTFVQSSKRMGTFTYKRQYPLMIQERRPAKKAKKSAPPKRGPSIEEVSDCGDDSLKENPTIQERLRSLLWQQQQAADFDFDVDVDVDIPSAEIEEVHEFKTEGDDLQEATSSGAPFSGSAADEEPEIGEPTVTSPLNVELPDEARILEEICDPEALQAKVDEEDESVRILKEIIEPATAAGAESLSLDEKKLPEGIKILEQIITPAPASKEEDASVSTGESFPSNIFGSKAPEDAAETLQDLLIGGYNPTLSGEKSLVPSKKLENISSHLNTTQSQLEQLKDFFSSSFVDSNLLMSLFNGGESPEYSMPFTEIAGKEIAPYEVDDEDYKSIFADFLDGDAALTD